MSQAKESRLGRLARRGLRVGRRMVAPRKLTHGQMVALYETLLGRTPSEDEASRALRATGGDLRSALTTIVGSEEYPRPSPVCERLDPRQTGGNRESDLYYRLLAGSRWSDDALEARMIEAGFPIPNPYFDAHGPRFGELMRFLDAVHARRPIESLLEVGPTYFTTYFYRELLGDIRLVTVDRPVEQGGESSTWASEAGAAAHHNVDLNLSAMSVQLGGPVDEQVDLIVCSEVVEHLVVDPADVLRDLLALLKPGGLIYLTTPNFLSLRSVRTMADGGNPMSRFSRADGNVDAHYHMREYTIEELLWAVDDAGGATVLAAYSSCWDDADDLAASAPNASLRGNLVLVVGRRDDHEELRRWILSTG